MGELKVNSSCKEFRDPRTGDMAQVIWITEKFKITKSKEFQNFPKSFFRISKMEQAQKIAWFIQNKPPEAGGTWLPVRPGIAKYNHPTPGAYFSESKIFLIWIP